MRKGETEREVSNKKNQKRGEMTNDTTEIQTILREYCEKLYANKLNNLEEMDNSQKDNLLKLKQEETENLNRPVTSNETESKQRKKKTSKTKIPGPDDFTGEFYKY